MKGSPCPSVQLELDSRPERVALVRAMLVGVGEMIGLGPELTTDLQIAVTEACNNVAMHAYAAAPGPLRVEVTVTPHAIEITVSDEGRGLSTPVERPGLGMAVIESLAARARFASTPAGGTEVTMAFEIAQKDLFAELDPSASTPDPVPVPGEVVVSVAPVKLLAAILGRVAGLLAAEARFAIDRYPDLYLVTDGIAEHAREYATVERVCAGLAARPGQLELTAAPFRAGTGALLQTAGTSRAPRLLALVVDCATVESMSDSESVHLMLVDLQDDQPPAVA